jgi:hypothetical protein
MCPSLLAGCVAWALSACWLPRATVTRLPPVEFARLQLERSAAVVAATPPTGADVSFHWTGALGQSVFLLGIQHALRMAQNKTRTKLGGPFWSDYRASLSGLHGWDDGNPAITNYGGHPMMGAIAGFIQIQNDPPGRTLVWNPDNPEYWKSRFKALGWSALYSTSYELAPWGEAGIGNVGMDRGTMGYVDLVVTPLAGFGLILLEDYVDKRVIEGIERGKSAMTARVLRVLLNPDRGVANMLRFKRPSHRDTRELPLRQAEAAPLLDVAGTCQ